MSSRNNRQAYLPLWERWWLWKPLNDLVVLPSSALGPLCIDKRVWTKEREWMKRVVEKEWTKKNGQNFDNVQDAVNLLQKKFTHTSRTTSDYIKLFNPA